MNILQGLLRLVTTKSVKGLRMLLLLVFGDLMPYQFETSQMPGKTYDFIVVGAGAAGSVVASRLSETNAHVLLLEAGGSAPPESALLGLFPLLLSSGEWDWGFSTVRKKHLQKGFVKNRVKNYFQGKAVGGSTVINTVVYTRGSRHDYDSWAEMGNSGWDYDSILPYFKKSEDFKGFETPITDKYHGRGGPLTVEKKRFNTRMIRLAIEAGRGLGLKVVDSSLPNQIGIAPNMLTIKDGFRASAAEAFLRPVVHRKNLFIKPRALVTKVLFNDKKRAIGVQYKHNGRVYHAWARKEVIVSAGAINTPKLLMLSGVGPQQHLRQKRIPLVAAVEGVGKNLREHYGYSHIPFAVKKGTALAFDDPVGFFKEFTENRTGVLSAPTAHEFAGFAVVGDGDKEWADIFFGLGSGTLATDDGLFTKNVLGYRDEYYDALYGPVIKNNVESVGITIHLARPDSAGWVKLASRDPETPPLIDFNFFDHPNDMKLLLKGLKLMFSIIEAPEFRDLAEARYISNPLPGCTHIPHLSESYWECHARALVSPGWHSCGTSKMAPLSDPLGVVDSKLRLRGVTGVRIVDASIMPQVITANTMSTAYMIAEKGADLIKQDWGYHTDPLSR